MPDVRRTVWLTRRIRKGERGRLWAFGYPELAALVGKSEGAVRLDVSRGRLDPNDLNSIFAWMTRVRAKKKAAS